MARESDQAKRFLARKAKQHGKAKALGILAARLGRAVYHMLRQKKAFDSNRFWNGEPGGRSQGSGVRDQKNRTPVEARKSQTTAKPRRRAKAARRVLEA